MSHKIDQEFENLLNRTVQISSNRLVELKYAHQKAITAAEDLAVAKCKATLIPELDALWREKCLESEVEALERLLNKLTRYAKARGAGPMVVELAHIAGAISAERAELEQRGKL